MANIPQTPEVPYFYYKLVTNVIRAVKIHVLSYPCYTVRNGLIKPRLAFSSRNLLPATQTQKSSGTL